MTTSYKVQADKLLFELDYAWKYYSGVWGTNERFKHDALRAITYALEREREAGRVEGVELCAKLMEEADTSVSSKIAAAIRSLIVKPNDKETGNVGCGPY